MQLGVWTAFFARIAMMMSGGQKPATYHVGDQSDAANPEFHANSGGWRGKLKAGFGQASVSANTGIQPQLQVNWLACSMRISLNLRTSSLSLQAIRRRFSGF